MADKMNSTSLGEIIRRARVERKQSLRDFAKDIGISASYASDIENDRRVPAEDTLKRICEKLELKYEELMALAGRFGEQAKRYLRQQPVAGVLLRKISEKNLSEDQLRRLLHNVDDFQKKREGSK